MKDVNAMNVLQQPDRSGTWTVGKISIVDQTGAERAERWLEHCRWAFLMVGDIAAVCVSVALGFVLSGLLRTSFDLPAFVQSSVWQTVLAVLFFPMVIQLWLSYRWGHYTRFKSFWTEVSQLTKMTCYSAALGFCVLFLLRMHFSRLWILMTIGCLLVINPVSRLLMKRLMAFAGIWFRPLIVVGTSDRALEGANGLCDDLAMGYKVAAIVRLDSAQKYINSSENFTPGFLTSFEAGQLVREVTGVHHSPHILYAMDTLDDFRYYTVLLDQLTMESENVIIAPPLTGIPLSGTELVGVSVNDSIMLRLDNNLRKLTSRAIKRLFDVVVASLLVVALSPILVFVYLQLMREGGSPIFAHQRIGRQGRVFRCLKFRSMVPDANVVLAELLANDEDARREWTRDFKLKNDPRITALGKFLRKSNIDELPQLFNVLKGDMSLVGPRPIVADEIDRYGDKYAYYRSTWPGMTGMWQTSGRNDLSYVERVDLDVRYVRNWSLWQDIVTLLRTFPLFVRAKGAY